MSWEDKLDLSHQVIHLKIDDNEIYHSNNVFILINSEQLSEIRKASVSRIFCDNSDDLHTIQPQGFLKISEK
jgi:hypothetical protein